MLQGAGEVQNTLLERLRDLETENCNLTRDAELQRRQYERCLDDVANQVVRALLTQKVGTVRIITATGPCVAASHDGFT